jgi:hypothetical protein
MAETSSAEYSNSGGGQIVADVLARRQRAKVIRDLWMPLYQECFDYAMPYRQSFYEESPGQKRTHKIFDDTAVVGVQEFASRLQDGIAPANARFCDLLAGTEFDPDRIAYLASLGIGQREAQLLARMPVERTPSGQLILPAIHNWGDERARKIFFNAMLAEENRTIITPGPADLPNLARGVVGVGNRRYESQLFGLPFQFLSFSLAAHNKLLVSALQGRERNTMGGFVALMGLGFFIDYTKSPAHAWGQKPIEEKVLRAYELSGAGG